MRKRRSPHLRRLNLLIGAILVIAGLTGGFLLTFWLLIVLVPLTCIAASWTMVFTARRARDVHFLAAPILSGLFLLWLAYFAQYGAEMPTWYGIFMISALLLGQAAVYLAAIRQQDDSADAN
jgi:CDP-diglyceride synthetase